MTISKITSQNAILGAGSLSALEAYMNDAPQWPFDLAAQDTGLPPELLRKLVRDGVLKGEAPHRVAGVVGTCDIRQARDIAQRLAAARQPVEGQGILATEAQEKYGFTHSSIYAWNKAGWVKVIESRRRGKLLNEGDIAFARALSDMTGRKGDVFPARPRSGRPKKM